MKIIGVKRVDFTPKGEDPIKGYKVHCTLKAEDTAGLACESFFVSDTKAAGWVPEVGREVELVYNKFGKIDRVVAA
ncbi:MAG: hypothetical protein EOM51_05490 [Clostridia bacterium]|nr:hypothetical protein [Clostridia bacterium]